LSVFASLPILGWLDLEKDSGPARIFYFTSPHHQMNMTIPSGFCRVNEIAKTPAERQALYDELKLSRLPCLKSGGGKHGTVFLETASAAAFLERRRARLNPEPKAIPSTKNIPPASESDQIRKLASECERVWQDRVGAFCNIVNAFTKNQEVTGGKIDETNRLLGELLKVWGAGK